MTDCNDSNPARPFHFAHRALIALALFQLALGLALAPLAGAMPTVEFAHVGSVNPEGIAEGWSRLGFAFPGMLYSGLADLEIGPRSFDWCQLCGLTAWGIDDRSGVAGSILRYERTPSLQQVLDAGALGWTLRVRLRLAPNQDNQGPLDPVDGSVMAEFREGPFGGARRFRMIFGTPYLYSPNVTPSST